MMKQKISFSIYVIFMMLYGPLMAQDKLTLPNTRVGEIAIEFFEAFNSEDRQVMNDFTATKRTPTALKRISLEKRMEMFDYLKESIQQLEPRHILKNEPDNLLLLSYSKPTDSWYKIGFTLSEDSSQLLEGFSLRPGKAPKSNNDIRYGEWKNLNELLSNVITKTGIPGISMVSIANNRIDEIGVAGVRKMGGEDKITKNDRFHIGSVTKSMTATLIGKLIEDELITPSTTLRSVYPDMEMHPKYENVTIRDLMDHRGGIPSYLIVSDEEEAMLLAIQGSSTDQRHAFVKHVLMQEPINEPGTVMSYSNAGYSILGAISEQVTGKSWESLMQEIVFDPLKINTAGFGWPNTVDPDQPAGYFGPLNELRLQQPDEYNLGSYLDPAGDVHCSMKDLSKFVISHMRGMDDQKTILDPNTIQMLHQPIGQSQYTAGWFIQKNDNQQTIIEHAGSAGTFMAYMAFDPVSNEGWVIAANVGDMRLDGIFREVIDIYRSK